MTGEYKICKRCIIDTSVPGAKFDVDGICNFCDLQDSLEAQFPLDKTGEKMLETMISKVRKSGKGKKYDCVLGVSGGRDSIYTLYMAKKHWGLNPLAVHFNDGFGNPEAGKNMQKATEKLGVDLRTITSDWIESKDLKIAFLKASTPDMEESTDLGIATALFGVATSENIKYIIIGQSFRTEGIAPLEWNYLDGKYLKAVHKKFGTVKLKKWTPTSPGFTLGLYQMFYYTIFKGIKTVLPLYLCNYNREEASKIIERELDWVNPGAHYFDDLYQSLMTNVHRKKFGIDRRIYNYSALIRSGQKDRSYALEQLKTEYVIEDPKVIELCIKRLGLTREQFDSYIDSPPKSFRDYPNHYNLIKMLKIPIKILSHFNFIPKVTYDKYFNCG